MGGENYDLLYQNSIRKYEDDLENGYLYFVWFVIFLNVMALQFKITSEKMATLMNEGWLFIGRFNVGRLPRMIQC